MNKWTQNVSAFFSNTTISWKLTQLSLWKSVLSLSNVLLPNRSLRIPIRRKISSHLYWQDFFLKLANSCCKNKQKQPPKNEVYMRCVYMCVDISLFKNKLLTKYWNFMFCQHSVMTGRFPKLFSVSTFLYCKLFLAEPKRSRNKVGGGNKERI